MHLLNTPPGKLSSGTESAMYTPLSGILNLGLEMVSKIEVDGLPKFKNHIVFIPLNQWVASNRDMPGSSFKPDIGLLSLGT